MSSVSIETAIPNLDHTVWEIQAFKVFGLSSVFLLVLPAYVWMAWFLSAKHSPLTLQHKLVNNFDHIVRASSFNGALQRCLVHRTTLARHQPLKIKGSSGQQLLFVRKRHQG